MSIKNMAVVNDATSEVENMIVYDDTLPPERQWQPPAGCSIVAPSKANDGDKAEIGGTYAAGKFARKPVEPPAPEVV